MSDDAQAAESVEHYVELDGARMHVVQDGDPAAPTVLLIHGVASSTAWWDPVVARLAATHRVLRVDLLGHGTSSPAPDGAYDTVSHARRVREALDILQIDRVSVIGHSTGCVVATALAELRPEAVTGLALADMGPTPAAAYPESVAVRVLMSDPLGGLLWRLRNRAAVRKALDSAFTRPVDIPDTLIENVMGMTHPALTRTARGTVDYLETQDLPNRLTALGVPVLVIFGTVDRRWRSSSADEFGIVPGVRIELLPEVGHSPMIEEPRQTGALLLEFLADVAIAE